MKDFHNSNNIFPTKHIKILPQKLREVLNSHINQCYYDGKEMTFWIF